MSIDSSGRILDVNPAAARLVGLPITEALGRPLIEGPLEDGMELSRTVTDARGSTVDLDMRVSALRDNRLREQAAEVPGPSSAAA
ncbi:PAS domain-containing protein [Planobispora takensis]|nr:PAS domain-containing protein [Planobispora takensis]